MTIFRDKMPYLGMFEFFSYICPYISGMKTNSTSKIILSGASTIMHSLIVPVFVLLFTIYYRPYGVYDVLHMEHASFAFNATILFRKITPLSAFMTNMASCGS